MSDRSDSFDRANGSLNGSTPSGGGSAWVANANFAISSNQVAATTTNAQREAAWLETGSAVGEVQFTLAVNGQSTAAIMRAADANNFIAAYVTSNQLALYKKVGGTYTLLGTAWNGTIANGAVIKLGITSSNAISGYVDEVLRCGPVTDSAGSTNTLAGIEWLSSSITTRVDDWSFTDLSGPVGSITVTGPVANVIGRGGKMTVAGTYTGTSTGLERRVVLAGTSTVVSGYDWAAAGGTFTGGAFSFILTGVPNGGWYECQVRFADNVAVTATSPRWAQGRWLINAGQSNGLQQLSGSAFGGVVSNDKLRAYGDSVTAWAAITPPGGNETGNALIAADGLPVLIIQAAVGGTSLASWQAGQSSYNGMTAKLTALADYGSGADAVLWDQGEQEAQNGTSYATHKAGLESFIASIRTALSLPNMPFIVGSLSTISGAFTATDANWNNVVRALKDVGTQNANCYFVDRTDLAVGDGIHLAGAGQQAYGKRRGRAALVALGLATGYRGPRIRKIDRVDAVNYDLQLTHTLGTDITPSSGITGISVEDPSNSNASLTVSSAARTGASTIRVVLAAGPSVGGTQPLFSILRGPSAVISAPAKDNSANTLPLEYTYQQPSRTKATQVVFSGTTRLESAPGVAAANATGLEWAVFAEAKPSLLTAPVAKGSNAAITGGTGTCTLDISAADIDAGAVAWVDLSSSDGTTTQSPRPAFFSGPALAS